MTIDAIIDLILVVAFLILNLGLGVSYGCGIKSINSFALGGRNFSTPALVATVIATWIGGSTLDTAMITTYAFGILALSHVGKVIKLLFTAYVLVPRMQGFLGKLSVAEVMGDIYGTQIRVITAVCSVIKSTTSVAMQIKVFSVIFNYFFYLNNSYATIISSIILVIYSAYGGIKAVVLTDILQFIAFGVFIPTLALLVWNRFGDVDAVLNTLVSNQMFDPKILLDYHNPTVLKYYGVFVFLITPSINPAMFQRILIARTTTQASQAFIISSLVCLLFLGISSLIGIVLLSSNITIATNSLLPYIIDSYTYTGFKAMIVIGVIAMIMSTADSHINTASIILINDLCKPLNLFVNNKCIELIIVRMFSVVVGGIALYMSLSQDSALDILLFGSAFYTPMIGVPLILTILGFRTTSKAIVSGMIAGALATYIWSKYFNDLIPIGNIALAAIVNLVVTISMHYMFKIKKGSREIEKYRKFDSVDEKCNKNGNVIYTYWCNLINKCTFENVLAYCSNDIFYSKHYYVYYVIFSTISLLIMALHINSCYTSQPYGQTISNLIINFNFILTALLICLKKTSQEFQQRYIGLIWHIAIFHTLVVNNTLLYLIGGLSSMLTVCFVINLLAVVILLKCSTATIMIITGIPIATSFFSFTGLKIDVSTIKYVKCNIAGSLYLIGAMIMLIKLRQDQFADHAQKLIKLENKILDLSLTIENIDKKVGNILNSQQYIFNNLNHEIKSPMSVAYTTINLLYQFLPKYYKSDMIFKEQNKLLSMLEIANSETERLVSYINNLFDLSQLERGDMIFDIRAYSLKSLIQEVVEECNRTQITDKHIISVNWHVLAETVVEFDYMRLRQVMLNLISNAIHYSGSGRVTVNILPYPQGVEISIDDEGVGIAEDELEKIFEPFEEGSRTRSPSQGRGLGLAIVRKIVLHHHGKVWASNRLDSKGSKFIVRLPLCQPDKYSNKMSLQNKQTTSRLEVYDQCANHITGSAAVINDNIASTEGLDKQISTHKSIMIIDDDCTFLNIMSLEMRMNGYKVTLVNDPFKAIELIKECPSFYSMIILDMVMPGKSGSEVLSEIRQITKLNLIPVAITSGYTQPYETRMLLYSMGAKAFIVKPHTTEDIQKLINQHLRQSTRFDSDISTS